MSKVILAFETSCDDTSVALFEDDRLVSMDTASQIKVHNITWWVVPEVAAREHANAIFGVLNKALEESWKSLEDIDYIWVTMMPWLIPSLLTGITVANTLSNILKIPLVEIHHIEAHIFANFLDRREDEISYPLVCLTVSGGHNEIYYMKNMWDMYRIGWTTDDAAWEAFDKVSKMMWLGYPGWPIVSKYADDWENEKSNKGTELFPRVWLDKNEFDFSFSGLKSAVKREIDKKIREKWKLSEYDKREISYEFQEAVTEVLAYKLVNAAEKKRVKTVMLAWWVSANNKLKEKISVLAKERGLKFIYPKIIKYCLDNAAMVWINAFYKIEKNREFNLT